MSKESRRKARRLEQIRGKADIIIDTTDLRPECSGSKLPPGLRKAPGGRFQVSVVSFGFRHGIPIDTDLVFDVRFLPNPHYVPSLSPFTGNDEAVKNSVFQWPVTRRFIAKLEDLLKFLLPQYEKEGKPQLVIGIGCTGDNTGRWPSPTISTSLPEDLAMRPISAIEN